MTLVPIDPTADRKAQTTTLAPEAVDRSAQAADGTPANGNNGAPADPRVHASDFAQTPRWGMLCHKVQIHPADD